LRRRPLHVGLGAAGAAGADKGLRAALRTRAGRPRLSSLIRHAMRLTILYAEDNRIVSEAVHDLLTEEGWSVDSCADGSAAMNRLAGGFAYDLLLLDNELPGASGLELARYARNLLSYRHTPIVMLSASDCRAEALRAGVDLFLRKPEGIAGLVDAVRKLTE
jgi:CheY-like chemotaxis protein